MAQIEKAPRNGKASWVREAHGDDKTQLYPLETWGGSSYLLVIGDDDDQTDDHQTVQ